MKPLTCIAWIALSLSTAACSDRDAAPADTAAAPAAAAPEPIEPAASQDSATPPATPTGACEGLTGQARTDCLTLAGPISRPPTTTDPATTEPTLTNPTPDASDAATPPTP